MNIFLCLSLTDVQRARLGQALPDDDISYFPDPEEGAGARDAFTASEVVFGNPPAHWLNDDRLPSWIQLESVGFGEYLGVGQAAHPQFPRVTNLAGFFTEPVAQSILAGVLAHYRGLDRLQALQHTGKWVGEELRPQLRLLANAEVVMIGKGHINNRVAQLLSPFGCLITQFGRDFVEADLDSALRNSDVVICCAPHTPESQGLFDSPRFALLKPQALFLNFGRGSLIDEDALADALASGRLSGAVIDVTADEPLPPGHRFWTTPHLTLTQHTAGGFGNEVDGKIDLFLTNLAHYRGNEPLRNLVDFTRGY